MQFEVRGDQGGGEFGVGGGAGARAKNVGRDVVDLFAVFVRDDRAAGRTGVGCDLGRGWVRWVQGGGGGGGGMGWVGSLLRRLCRTGSRRW